MRGFAAILAMSFFVALPGLANADENFAAALQEQIRAEVAAGLAEDGIGMPSLASPAEVEQTVGTAADEGMAVMMGALNGVNTMGRAMIRDGGVAYDNGTGVAREALDMAGRMNGGFTFRSADNVFTDTVIGD